jgi:multidrug efflux pump subunit AcrB
VRVKVAEVPPGPPVLETLVAEIHGPTFANRLTVAQQVKHVMQTTPGVTDVDWYVDDRRTEANFIIDKQKAALAGVNETEIENTLRIALAGESIGLAHDQAARENVDITLRLPRRDRTGINDLLGLYVPSRTGQAVPLIELVTVKNEAMDGSIYHKNLMPVVYVTGDVIGKQASPVYAILAMNPRLGKIRIPEGGNLNVLSIHPPLTTDKTAMKWDGEWYITYEVFRDMGVAFAVVMVLIYLLVVGWFQSFKAPLAIMAPIPMTLIGILPAHALLGAYFTATSMIGIIAGAGIITRNSIIIVDFIELRLRQGMPLDQAVIDAGATRFRPILLTAAAVAVGAVVILADPIFQGLAISLMAGAIASTMLSLPAVPVLYFMLHRKDYEAKTSGGDTKSPQASHTHTGE